MRLFASTAAAMLLAASAPALATDFSFTGPISVPATGTWGLASPFPITFNVSGLGQVADVNLTLTGLSHTWSDDLQIALLSPTGTLVLLMNDAGGSANWSNATLTFDQQASQTIANLGVGYGGNNGTIPGGSYQPSTYSVGLVTGWLIDGTNLDLFNGENANGSWHLYIRDDKLLDKGSIASATLSILSTSAVPEPASWALMITGLGLAGGAMRRSTRRKPACHAA